VACAVGGRVGNKSSMTSSPRKKQTFDPDLVRTGVSYTFLLARWRHFFAVVVPNDTVHCVVDSTWPSLPPYIAVGLVAFAGWWKEREGRPLTPHLLFVPPLSICDHVD